MSVNTSAGRKLSSICRASSARSEVRTSKPSKVNRSRMSFRFTRESSTTRMGAPGIIFVLSSFSPSDAHHALKALKEKGPAVLPPYRIAGKVPLVPWNWDRKPLRSLFRRFDFDLLENFALRGEFCLACGEPIQTQNIRQHVGVLRHGLANAVKEISNSERIPVGKKPGALQGGRFFATRESAAVTVDAFLLRNGLTALGLVFGECAVPNGARGLSQGRGRKQDPGRRPGAVTARHRPSSGRRKAMDSPEYAPPLTAITMYCLPCHM